jgi:hypothetical protein
MLLSGVGFIKYRTRLFYPQKFSCQQISYIQQFCKNDCYINKRAVDLICLDCKRNVDSFTVDLHVYIYLARSKTLFKYCYFLLGKQIKSCFYLFLALMLCV